MMRNTIHGMEAVYCIGNYTEKYSESVYLRICDVIGCHSSYLI